MIFFISCLTSVLCATAVRVLDLPAAFQTNSASSAYLKYDHLDECTSDTGGTCTLYSCNEKRGQTECVSGGFGHRKRCLCSDGYCARGVFEDKKDNGHYCFQTCSVSGLRCSDAEINQDPKFVCGGVTCSKKECCIPRGKCDGSECDDATEVPTKHAKLCEDEVCRPVECCESRGNCENFACPNSTSRIDGKTALCKGKTCFSDECCHLDHLPLESKVNA
eukprot:TRINITY_DN3476_c0_g1_i1.p1 TRINITY_DN3476_c0_g1~~TRINITY_DN3476_c0_g1_i1.p1  ORF type:complete len:220 (-),score=16.81 TRINITY_DN3476_c0_g1_i1:360-1019(-)